MLLSNSDTVAEEPDFVPGVVKTQPEPSLHIVANGWDSSETKYIESSVAMLGNPEQVPAGSETVEVSVVLSAVGCTQCQQEYFGGSDVVRHPMERRIGRASSVEC